MCFLSKISSEMWKAIRDAKVKAFLVSREQYKSDNSYTIILPRQMSFF